MSIHTIDQLPPLTTQKMKPDPQKGEEAVRKANNAAQEFYSKRTAEIKEETERLEKFRLEREEQKNAHEQSVRNREYDQTGRQLE